MKRATEKRYPLITSLVVAAGFLFVFRETSLPTRSGDLLAAMVSVSAIAVGFLGTAIAILLPLRNEKAIKFISEAGRYSDLIEYLTTAIRLSFVLAVLSAAGILVDFEKQPRWLFLIASIWILLACWTTLAAYRVIHILGAILKTNG